MEEAVSIWRLLQAIQVRRVLEILRLSLLLLVLHLCQWLQVATRLLKAGATAPVAINNAVVTVPTYFNDSQHHLGNEHSPNHQWAHSCWHCLRSWQEIVGERNILIFNLGGGTFDVSLLTVEQGIFQVKATAGDTILVEKILINVLSTTSSRNLSARTKKVGIFWLALKLCTDYNFIDPSSSPRSLRRRRTACERAKRTFLLLLKLPLRLTLFSEVSTSIPLSHSCSFWRALPESVCGTLDLLRRSSATPRLTSPNIHEIVLVGGSTCCRVSSNSFPTSSTAKSLMARASAPTRLLPMVPQSKLPSFLMTPLRKLKTFSSSMLPLFPLVLRQLDCPHQA